MDRKKDLLIEWICHFCNADLGSHPGGIRIYCPVCKKENILPGLEIGSKNQSKSLQAIKKQAKKEAQERYRAMRDQ